MPRVLFGALLAALAMKAASSPGKPVDEVVRMYVQAIGGQPAIDRIESREVRAGRRRGPKMIYYWQKPNKVLLVNQKEKTGYDGGSGWYLSKKKKVSKLAKGAQRPMEMIANPLRYVALQHLYPDIAPGPPAMLDSRKMDVLISPNELGATKFFFDSATHLLARIEETGDTSAYYRHVTDFEDYKIVDGIKLPFRFVQSSTEPGVRDQEIRVAKIEQNIPLKTDMFNRPSVGSVTLGGKR